MMLQKLDIENDSTDLYQLVYELIALMQTLKLDYTNTFIGLSEDGILGYGPMSGDEFKSWLVKWKNTINKSVGFDKAKKIMCAYNPALIPRNYLVEEALDNAVDGNFNSFEKLLEVVKKTSHFEESLIHFISPPNQVFEQNYATYCGT